MFTKLKFFCFYQTLNHRNEIKTIILKHVEIFLFVCYFRIQPMSPPLFQHRCQRTGKSITIIHKERGKNFLYRLGFYQQKMNPKFCFGVQLQRYKIHCNDFSILSKILFCFCETSRIQKRGHSGNFVKVLSARNKFVSSKEFI